MQYMVTRLCADVNGDQRMFRRLLLGFAPRDQIWPWSPHRILDHICKEGRKHDADSKAKDRDIGFVIARLEYNSPYYEKA